MIDYSNYFSRFASTTDGSREALEREGEDSENEDDLQPAFACVEPSRGDERGSFDDVRVLGLVADHPSSQSELIGLHR